jgi:hypothetical protein
MSIDKALNRAPSGLADLLGVSDSGPALEIEIEDPEAVRINAGGMEINLGPDEQAEGDFSDNLAETMDESALMSMAEELAGDIENDLASRKDWEETYVEGLKLMGLKYEERMEPWSGACGVVHPMITEAVVRFQAETVMETFPSSGPVMTKIIGKETPEKLEAAERVKEDMNYQLTERMIEYRPEHEKMLWNLPATGSAFKKVYYDPSLGRQVAVFIPAEDVVLPYGVSDIYMCHRVTHVMRKTKNEIKKLQQAGFYRDIDLPDPDKNRSDIKKAKDSETGFSDIHDERYTLYEAHADLSLDPEDEEGIALPYVVTLIKGSNDVLAIRRNWREDDDLRLKRQHFVHYQYIPGFGSYGFGLFHLIGNFAKSATSLTRQLVDAGTLSNLPGGLKSRSLRIKGDDTPISPGEFRDVDVGSGTIRDSILPLPYKEPSQTLLQLLGNIIEDGRRFAATADVKISDMGSQAPVGTTLAILERQLKPLSAVQARIHYTLKQELRLLAEIIRDYSDDSYSYEPETGTAKAKKEDYEDIDILPVSDPNAATMAQRIVQYQAVIQMAQMAPDIYDLPELHRGMLNVLGIKNAAKLVPLKDDIKPMDPVTENARALKGEPVKAFLHQDHTAHIAVHNAMMQDPMIQQKIGQNPRAQQIMAALQDHITEHVAFEYRQQIESQLGLPLPPPDEELPPEAENALSAMMAQAGQQQLQESQQQAQQQQAQQQAQDPVLQMQQQELQIKQQQVQIEQQKAQTDMQKSMQELEFRREQMERELQLKQEQMERDYELKREQMERDYEFKREQMEATSLREGLKMGLAKEKDDATHMREGMRLGLEKDREDANQTREGLKLGMSYNAPAKEAPQKSKQPPDKKE